LAARHYVKTLLPPFNHLTVMMIMMMMLVMLMLRVLALGCVDSDDDMSDVEPMSEDGGDGQADTAAGSGVTSETDDDGGAGKTDGDDSPNMSARAAASTNMVSNMVSNVAYYLISSILLKRQITHDALRRALHKK